MVRILGVVGRLSVAVVMGAIVAACATYGRAPATADCKANWQGSEARFSPAVIEGQPGDEVEFTLKFRPALSTYHGRLDVRAGPWVDVVEDDPSASLQQHGTLRARVVVGADYAGAHPAVSIGEGAHRVDVCGPPVAAKGASLTPVTVTTPRDFVELPEGLSATREGRRVVVIWAPSQDDDSCCGVKPAGQFHVRTIGGRTTLVGFVTLECHHLCMPGPPQRNRLEASFDANESETVHAVMFVGTNGRSLRSSYTRLLGSCRPGEC